MIDWRQELDRLFEKILPRDPLGEWVKPTVTTDGWPDTDRHRTAVHEAGHALAAWLCTCVPKVLWITIDGPDGGLTRYDILNSDEHDVMWCQTAILLAGIAAETIVYGKFRSGHSAGDLTKARAAVPLKARPPWDTVSEFQGAPSRKAPPFEKMFKEIAPDEVVPLKTAYAMARELVVRRRAAVMTLAHRAMERERVEEKEIEIVFGSRRVISMLGLLNNTFVMPSKIVGSDQKR